MNGISRETFMQMDTDSKLNVLFDFAVDAHQIANVANETTKELTETVRRRRKFDTAFSGAMGFLGGFIAMLGGKLWGIK